MPTRSRAQYSRQATPWSALIVSTVAALPTGPWLTAQEPQAAVTVLVRHQGRPVEGAEVRFLRNSAPDLPLVAPLLHPPAAIPGSTNVRGDCRLTIDDDAPGVLLVKHGTALGALVADRRPGEAARVELQPIAEVTLSGQDEEFTLWPAVASGSGTLFHLEPMRGSRLRLPAGDYVCWWRRGDDHGSQRLRLRPGSSTALAWDDAPMRLLRAPDTTTTPSGFPHVAILTEGRGQTLLHGLARVADLHCEWTPPRCFVDRPAPTHSDAPDGTTFPSGSPEPAAPLTVQVEGVPTGAAAQAFVVEQHLQGGEPRIVGRARFASDAHAVVPWPTWPGNFHLLVRCEKRATLIQPLAELQEAASLVLRQGRPIRLRVSVADGSPAAGARVRLVSASGLSLAEVRTDSSGRAHFAHADAFDTVRIEATDHLPMDVAAPEGDGALLVRLSEGAAVTGRVLNEDGSPAAGVAVSLKWIAPTVPRHPLTRLTDADGAFRFGGLQAATEVGLFVQRTQHNETWSTTGRTRAGAPPTVLQLQHEDPQLRPTDRGQRGR